MTGKLIVAENVTVFCNQPSVAAWVELYFDTDWCWVCEDEPVV